MYTTPYKQRNEHSGSGKQLSDHEKPSQQPTSKQTLPAQQNPRGTSVSAPVTRYDSTSGALGCKLDLSVHEGHSGVSGVISVQRFKRVSISHRASISIILVRWSFNIVGSNETLTENAIESHLHTLSSGQHLYQAAQRNGSASRYESNNSIQLRNVSQCSN